MFNVIFKYGAVAEQGGSKTQGSDSESHLADLVAVLVSPTVLRTSRNVVIVWIPGLQFRSDLVLKPSLGTSACMARPTGAAHRKTSPSIHGVVVHIHVANSSNKLH